MRRRAAALALWAGWTAMAGCGMNDQDKRDWVSRVLRETPRIAQVAFGLPEPPKNPYPSTGKAPDWIGEVSYERFEWRKEGDGFVAEAAATAAPGLGLAAKAKPVRVELSVSFAVRVTPPPVIFLPKARSIIPSRWTLRSVDGRKVEENGAFQSYLEQ